MNLLSARCVFLTSILLVVGCITPGGGGGGSGGTASQNPSANSNNGGSSSNDNSSGAVNDNSCEDADDGFCDDNTQHCVTGTDCEDCDNCGEPRVMQSEPSDLGTDAGDNDPGTDPSLVDPITPSTPDDSCVHANNSLCDEGLFCDNGTDCTDCENCEGSDPGTDPFVDAGTDPGTDPVDPGSEQCANELPAYCGPADCDVSYCLTGGQVARDTHCIDPGSSDLINATNACDFAIRVEVCFESLEGLPVGCGRSTIQPGESEGGWWTCNPNTGNYWAIVLPDDRSGVDCQIACQPGYNCN